MPAGSASQNRGAPAMAQPQSRLLAMAAPSRIASSLAHTTSSDTWVSPTMVPTPQSVPALTRATAPLQPLGDHLRVLDVVVRRFDDAADQGHAIGQLLGAEGVDLVAVTRIGEGQAERTRLHLVADRQHVGRRRVAHV